MNQTDETKTATTLNCPIENNDTFVERLASKLNTEPKYLTKDQSSWYIIVKELLQPNSQNEFNVEWDKHRPKERKQVHLYGKVFNETRWSQAWGNRPISYSGLKNDDMNPTEDSTMVTLLLEKVNDLMDDLMPLDEKLIGDDMNARARERKRHDVLYNACLQNWYEPNDSIGLHSDDENYLIRGMPIFSLSWGGTRRFIFRSKKKKTEACSTTSISEKVELWLEGGDLLIMGGLCQDTHKHEVPKLRKTLDPPTTNRINWTIRALH